MEMKSEEEKKKTQSLICGYCEEISQNVCDFVSNGIKFRHVDGKYHNSGGSYIYMAFAESPFVNSNGIPNNAR